MPLESRSLGVATFKSFVFVILMAQIYSHIGGSGNPIVVPFLVNSLLALCVLLHFSSYGFPFSLLPKRRTWLFVPLFFLLGALVLGLLSSEKVQIPDLRAFILPVMLVPIVEEIIFRMGLWSFFGRIPPGAKLYLTAASFACLHTNGSQIPLGPFLLGLVSQWMLLQGAGLVTVILLHMASNATIVIFLTLDPRWLDWLRIFYINN
ncbi:MAG: CPBP family intramembrane glutamic endopeptidase [Pseudomonadota bacterium]